MKIKKYMLFITKTAQKTVQKIAQKIVLVLIIVSFISCNNEEKVESVLLEKITTENLIEISDKISKNKNIQAEDLDYFLGYLNSYSGYRDSIFGKSPIEMINSQKNRELESKKQTLLQVAKKNTFNHSFAIVLDEIKPYDETDKMPVNLFIYKMSNMSKKTITKVEGFIEFYDNQSTLIKKYGVSVDYVIEPNKAITQQYPYNHDITNPRDIYIRENYKNTLIVWKPIKITFKDGSIIDLNIVL